MQVYVPVVMTENIVVTAENEKIALEKAAIIDRLRTRYNVHHFENKGGPIAFGCYAYKEE